MYMYNSIREKPCQFATTAPAIRCFLSACPLQGAFIRTMFVTNLSLFFKLNLFSRCQWIMISYENFIDPIQHRVRETRLSQRVRFEPRSLVRWSITLYIDMLIFLSINVLFFDMLQPEQLLFFFMSVQFQISYIFLSIPKYSFRSRLYFTKCLSPSACFLYTMQMSTNQSNEHCKSLEYCVTYIFKCA